LSDQADDARRAEAEARERLREVEAEADETLEEAEKLESEHESSSTESPEAAGDA
jgi:hypothetical protein